MKNLEHTITVLNKIICELEPIKFESINRRLPAKTQKGIVALEEEHNEVGLSFDDEKKYCSSVAALIATITDLLVGKRLAFKVATECGDGYERGQIVGFCWYVDPEIKEVD